MKEKNIYIKNKKLLNIKKLSDNLFKIKTNNSETISENLPAIIQNTLPEGVNRDKLVKELKIEDNDFCILQTLSDGLGGINVDGKIKSFQSIDFNYQILEINDIKIEDNIKNKFLSFNFSKNEIKNYFSISGYQPKFTAILEKNNMFYLRLKKENELSNIIIKTKNHQYPDINIIEYLYLKSLNDIGIKTSKVMLLVDLELNKSEFLRMPTAYLIIKRFDRDEKEPILAFELLSLIGKQSTEKYDISLEEILEFVYEKLLKQNKLDKNEFDKIALYYYLSFILHNADAHPKNITLLYDEKIDKYFVAPFYDIVNTFIYNIGQDNFLGIALTKNRVTFKENELLALFEKFNIDTSNYKNIKQNFFNTLKKEIKNFPFTKEFKEAYKQDILEILVKDLNIK